MTTTEQLSSLIVLSVIVLLYCIIIAVSGINILTALLLNDHDIWDSKEICCVFVQQFDSQWHRHGNSALISEESKTTLQSRGMFKCSKVMNCSKKAAFESPSVSSIQLWLNIDQAS